MRAPSSSPVRGGALVVVLVLLGGCAGAAKTAAPPSAEAARERPTDQQKPAEFERIVSSFFVHPEMMVYLTPSLAELHLDRCDELAPVTSIVNELARLGDVRGEAGARLNLAALAWCDGRGDDAYDAVMKAETLFTRAGDLDGVARAHEWLGFMFLREGQDELASEHLAVAYQVFLRLGDAASTTRVLAYAE